MHRTTDKHVHRLMDEGIYTDKCIRISGKWPNVYTNGQTRTQTNGPPTCTQTSKHIGNDRKFQLGIDRESSCLSPRSTANLLPLPLIYCVCTLPDNDVRTTGCMCTRSPLPSPQNPLATAHVSWSSVSARSLLCRGLLAASVHYSLQLPSEPVWPSGEALGW